MKVEADCVDPGKSCCSVCMLKLVGSPPGLDRHNGQHDG